MAINGTEMKERELNVLQRQRKKGANGSIGRGMVQGVLLKLQVKNKLFHSGKVPVNVKECQLRPLRREKRGYTD